MKTFAVALFVCHWGLQLHNYILLASPAIQSVVTCWLFLYQLQRWWYFMNCVGSMVSNHGALYIPTKPFLAFSAVSTKQPNALPSLLAVNYPEVNTRLLELPTPTSPASLSVKAVTDERVWMRKTIEACLRTRHQGSSSNNSPRAVELSAGLCETRAGQKWE